MGIPRTGKGHYLRYYLFSDQCIPFFRSRFNPHKRTSFSYDRDGTRFSSTHRSKVKDSHLHDDINCKHPCCWVVILADFSFNTAFWTIAHTYVPWPLHPRRGSIYPPVRVYALPLNICLPKMKPVIVIWPWIKLCEDWDVQMHQNWNVDNFFFQSFRGVQCQRAARTSSRVRGSRVDLLWQLDPGPAVVFLHIQCQPQRMTTL